MERLPESESLCQHRLWTTSFHENQGWSLVGSRGGHVSRRFDLSRPTLFVFFRMTVSSGDCTNSVSVTGAHPQAAAMETEPHATHCAQGRVQSQNAWASSPQDTAPVVQGSDSSRDECAILVDDRCVDNGIFQRRYLVHELVFACSPPPPRSQTSHTILTQADWCALRAVARCGKGL